MVDLSLAKPLAATLLLALPLACTDPPPSPPAAGSAAAKSSAAKPDSVATPAGDGAAVVPPPPVEFSTPMDAMLDLVPADAETYLVVRDLRPLVDRARQVEGIVAGPLTTLTRAFAGVDETVDASGMEALSKTLRDLIAGVDTAGVKLDAGLLLTSIDDHAVVLFAADSLAAMPALLVALGADGGEAALTPEKSCQAIAARPGWFGCSDGGKELVARYAAGGKGAERRAAMQAALPGVDVARTNVAFGTEQILDDAYATLSTNPGSWHLSVSLPKDELELFTKGRAKALRGARPGDSFVWASVDLSSVPAEAVPPQLSGLVDSLTGEAFLGIDHAAGGEEVGVMLQLGVRDPGPARGGIAYAASQLEGLPTSLPGAPDTTLRWGTEIVTPAAEKLAILTLQGEGPAAKTFSTALDLAPTATAFAAPEYLTVVVGEGKEVLPAHLVAAGSGASAELLRSLPGSLAQDLVDEQVSIVFHFEADGLQVPFDDEVLAYGLVGVPEDKRPDPEVLRTLYGFLAPYSSLSVWVSHVDDAPVVHLVLRDFDDAVTAEGRAAGAALARIAAGEDGGKVYGELADAHSGSPRAAAYLARAGRSDRTVSAMGLMTASVVMNLVTSAVLDLRMRSATQQLPPSLVDPGAGMGGMGAPPPGAMPLTPPGGAR